MPEIFVLMVYLSTFSTDTGMTTFTAEFTSEKKCMAAGQKAKATFGGIATRVYYTCAEK